MNKVLQLQKKLTQLAILDATFEVFGSESHQYQLKPCLSHKDIQVFESRYNITLPSEYKNFLLEIGNGGAGPGYGLSGIEYEDVIPEKLYQENYEILSKPFSLTEAWDLDLIVNNNTDGSISMSVESSLNLTPTLSLVRRGSKYLVSCLTKGGLRGVDLGYICKTEMLPIQILLLIMMPISMRSLFKALSPLQIMVVEFMAC